MKWTFALIFLLTCSTSLFAQTPAAWKDELDEVKVYTWEEAKSADPDTIYGISLSKLKLEELPSELSKFKNLRVLNLHRNKLTKLPDFICEFKNLEDLTVSRNKLELFPLQVCRMPSIKRLVLNQNFFENIPDCIGFSTELRYLDLYDTPIRSLPNSLTELKHLEEIDFSGIRFGPTFQENWIGLLPNVKLIFDAPCDCME